MNKKILILSLVFLVGCGERYNPNELNIVQYPVLQPPKDFNNLPVPNRSAKNLGYKNPENRAAEALKLNVAKENTLYTSYEVSEILNLFNIPKSQKFNIDSLDGKDQSIVLIIPKTEQKRINNAIKNNISIVKTQTRFLNIKDTKSPLDDALNKIGLDNILEKTGLK